LISLDDAAMARLLIAATGVPRAQRGRWLASLAGKLEAATRTPAASNMAKATARERTRAYRERLASGQGVMRLTVPVDDVACALVASGALKPGDEHDRQRVEEALGALLRDWAAAWHDRSPSL
jgi:hypothetical protein